jgi:hypothetical protein
MIGNDVENRKLSALLIRVEAIVPTTAPTPAEKERVDWEMRRRPLFSNSATFLYVEALPGAMRLWSCPTQD